MWTLDALGYRAIPLFFDALSALAPRQTIKYSRLGDRARLARLIRYISDWLYAPGQRARVTRWRGLSKI